MKVGGRQTNRAGYSLRGGLLWAVIPLLLAMMIDASAHADPPEFGRCVKVTPGVGKYKTEGCTALAGRRGGTFEWLAGPGANGTFSANYGYSFAPDAILTTTGPHHLDIDCPFNVSEGEYTGPKTLAMTMTLFQCHLSPTATGQWEWDKVCQSFVATGKWPGEIILQLTGQLGFYLQSGHKRIGIDLKPRSGSSLALFECGGANELTWTATGTGTSYALEGGVIARVPKMLPSRYAINKPLNHMTSEYATKLEVKDGAQFPEGLEGGAQDTLSLVTPVIGLDRTTEAALISAEEEVNELGEEIEIRTKG